MDIKPLVEGECGNSNPLIRVAQHYNQPQDTFRPKYEPARHISEQWAEELLKNSANNNIQNLNESNRFKMDSLLQSVENIQGNRLVNLSSNINSNDIISSNIWTNEFFSENVKVDDFFDVNKKSAFMNGNHNSKWAEEYLEKSEFNTSKNINGSRLTNNYNTSFDLSKNDEKNIWSTDNLEKPNNRYLIGQNFMNPIQNDLQNKMLYPVFYNKDNEKQKEEQLIGENKNLEQEKNNLNENLTEHQDLEDETGFWSTIAREYQKNLNNINYPLYEDNILNGSSENELFERDLPEEDKSNDVEKDFEQKGYVFGEENEYEELKDIENLFEEGLRKLKESDLPGAVKCFELACQKDSSKAIYWQYLGTSQASNEHDLQAINALKKCIEIEPSNLTALMALAVCYTNESQHQDACRTLKDWMLNNNKYNSVIDFVNEDLNQLNSNSSYPGQYSIIENTIKKRNDVIKNMFITAARLYPYEPDADVQCGLGVLFNITGEYEKAVDCFKCALTIKPDDPSLWNRLGATLANSSKSEEAVSAYRRALELNPGFIRTRYNLGIICVHLGAYREAVEHFLTVLNLQNNAKDKNTSTSQFNCKQTMSENVWYSLKFVIAMMKRHDLYVKLDERDLNHLNREFAMEF